MLQSRLTTLITTSRLLLIRLCVAFVLTGVTFAQTPEITLARDAAENTATSPAIPRGIFAFVGTRGIADGDEFLANPHVAGVSLARSWADVEPQPGAYDWSVIDAWIALAAAHDKYVRLSVAGKGRDGVPPWVLDKGVQVFSWVDQNAFHSTYGEVVSAPVFWDPIYLAEKTTYIQAAGAHLTDNPHLHVVVAACVNPNSDDWFFPGQTAEEAAQWQALGYTPEKLISACKDVLDATATAFPHQAIWMPVGDTSALLDADPSVVANEIMAYAQAAYPDRVLFGNGALSTKVPDPLTTTPLPARWQNLYDQRPYVVLQMLAAATDTVSCRLNGQIAPCDPATVLREAVTIGVHYETQFQEIYYADLIDPALATVVEEMAALLATVPTTTTPLRGDLDGDGKVTLADLRLLLSMLLGQTAVNLPAADLNGDGTLSLTDVQTLILACMQS